MKKNLLKIVSITMLSTLLFLGAKSSVVNLSAEESYPSPSRDGGAPEIYEVETEIGGLFAEAVVKDVGDDVIKWVFSVDLVSYADAIENKIYSQAPEQSRNGFIFKNLTDSYNDYANKPVREFAPDFFTNDYAKELSGNDSFDATNFCVSYLFDLSISEIYEESVLKRLYEREDNYLELNLILEPQNGIAPAILYKCNNTELGDPNATPEWKVNNSGVVHQVGDITFITYKFYTFCPMMLVETAEHTYETQLHPEWKTLYPTQDGEKFFHICFWFILSIILFVILVGSVAISISFYNELKAARLELDNIEKAKLSPLDDSSNDSEVPNKEPEENVEEEHNDDNNVVG